MCYSAQVWSYYRRYGREFRAEVGISEFRDLFFRRSEPDGLAAPDGNDLDAQQAILDDRERPFYEHYLEAA